MYYFILSIMFHGLFDAAIGIAFTFRVDFNYYTFYFLRFQCF